MTVLIAYDGSDDARAAIEYAAGHIKPEPAVVLTVWEPLIAQLAWAPLIAAAQPPGDQAGEDGETGQFGEERQAEGLARQGAELAAAAGLADAVPRAVRGNGPVWATIVDAAEELDVSLVVTGSRGLSAVRSVLLGSVSTRILHHVRRPILVVPPAKGG